MRLVFITFLFFFFLLETVNSQAQYNLSWSEFIINYDGACIPVIAGIVIDENENVYTCWHSPESLVSAKRVMFITKYSKDGTLIWSNQYNFQHLSTNGYYVSEIKRSGGILYVGGSWSQNSYSDMFISAIDTSGNFLWERITSVTCGDNLFAHLAVTPDGSAIVSGYSFNYQCSGEHTITTKYDCFGNIVWNKTKSDACFADGLFVDSLGNTYVSAYGQDSVTPNSRDVLLLKYDPSGNLIHETRFHIDSTRINENYITAILESPDHSIWLTGYGLDTINVQPSLIAAKLDSTGNLLYTYHDTASYRSIGYTITFDSISNCYVSGSENTIGSGELISTIKFNSNCQFLWKQLYGPPGCTNAHGFENWIDHQGNLYISSKWADSSNVTFDILQYDYNSSQLAFNYPVYNSRIDLPPTRGNRTVHLEDKIYYTTAYYTSSGYIINTAKLEKTIISGIEVNTSNQISFFPNPLSGSELYINSSLNIDRISIYDVSGKLLFKNKLSDSHFNLGNLNLDKGMFIVEIETKSKIFRQKLIVN